MIHDLIGIDHVLIGVDQLDMACQTWERLGFVTTARGRHIGWGTANYCIMFPDNYLELIGIVDATEGLNGLDRFLAGGDGPMGLAWASLDAEATAASLKAARLGDYPVKDLARQVELPDRTALARFKLVQPDGALTPGLSAFACQHVTPALLRPPVWLRHPNHAVGLHAVTMLVDDAPSLADAYGALFGSGAVNRTDDVLTVHIGRQTLVLANEDDLSVLHPDLDPDRLRPAPALVVITLKTASLAATAEHLTRWQVPFEQYGDISLTIAPEDATGVALEFVPI